MCAVTEFFKERLVTAAKRRICGKMIEKMFVTAVRRWYMREYGSVAHSADSLRVYFHEFQESGTVACRPRAGRALINTDDVAKIENGFNEDPMKSLKAGNAELGVPTSTIRNALQENRNVSVQNVIFAATPCRKLSSATGVYAYFCRELSNDSEYFEKISSLTIAYFIPME